MAEEPTTIQPQVPQETPAQDRIRQLSEKVELTSKERDEKDVLLKAANEKNAALEKENAFNTGFVDVLATHTAAKDHKDEIKAKVLAGYSVEDATFAVLGKAGKLGGAPVQREIAGGSAPHNVQGAPEKSVKEMTTAEKRAVLEKELIWQ